MGQAALPAAAALGTKKGRSALGSATGRTLQRQGERGARREFTRALEDLNRELEAYRGRVAPFGPLFTEMGTTAGARLKDVQRASGNILDYLSGLSFGGEPTGVGASVLSRQREAMGRGLDETQRATTANLAAQGLSASGPGAALQASNVRGFNQASAMAETQLRQQALQDLAKFAQGQQVTQGGLLQSGFGGLEQMTGTIMDFIRAMAEMRTGRAGVYGQIAQHGYNRENQLYNIASQMGKGMGSAAGSMGGMGGAGGAK